MLRISFAIALACWSLVVSAHCQDYSSLIQAEEPIAYWSFDSNDFQSDSGEYKPLNVGKPQTRPGAISPTYPLFSNVNPSLQLDGKSYLRIADPGPGSNFDFQQGDEITIEAWVAPNRLPGVYSYVIGKGRTFLPGMVKENHNWSLRLRKSGSAAGISFLFRSRGDDNEYHRWESSDTFAIGDGWHHIALTYTFGKKKSVRGYIDGQSVKGKWDLGGDTERAPMTNDDEVWIGSAMAGNPGSSFSGGLDEIAIYRKTLKASQLASHYAFNAPKLPPVSVPENEVLIEVLSGIPNRNGWQFRSPKFLESFTQSTFAVPQLPKRYNDRGIHIDRPAPLLLRCYADVVIPPGPQQLLFRSREASRLFLDDELLGETDFYSITQEANGEIWDLDRSYAPNINPLQRGDRQKLVHVQGDGKKHRLRLEILVGLQGRRSEMGDASLSIAAPGEEFRLISFGEDFALTEQDWPVFREWDRLRLQQVNHQRRLAASKAESEYWEQRHHWAASRIKESGHDSTLNIDHWVKESVQPSSQDDHSVDADLKFLRRAALDIIGTIPSRQLIADYLKQTTKQRREWLIERLLNDEGWADHWVGYWQDVLAENPNIVNPTLNNTGPFRWWIHESFLHNKPLDRWVTELIMMEGSLYDGGPGGFSLASGNDVPMAAKSHLLAQAFLGVQMQCARCHDAPSHDVEQQDLFSVASMLARKPTKVPKTSSIDLPAEELENMLVTVSLKPGSAVAPAWPFGDFIEQPEKTMVRNPDDTREQLAALVTSPDNSRFSRVMVNRIWHRMMGEGLVDSLEDWETAEVHHRPLLNWLANEFVVSGYDAKQITRLILRSQVYQNQTQGDAPRHNGLVPRTKQLQAEQLLDSLFVISGKPYNAGMIAFDIDGARPAKLSLNLGAPRRAWMFTSTSNERDRPGLALPFAEPFVTFLEQFGWTGARQNPINSRPDDLTALQPAEFANGILAQRTIRLSDDNALTSLAMRAEISVGTLTDELFLRVFTRYPSPAERGLVTQALTPGFSHRRRPNQPLAVPPPDRRGTISWSNHLEQEASTIKMELERVVRAGDPATQRLTSEWREQLEDVIWSLLNSPEFRFYP